MFKIAVIPGDGIGKEVMEATINVLDALNLDFEYTYGDAGDEFLEKTGALESQIYLAYDQLKKHRDNVGITCYEIIMPNPIQQFALTTIKKQAIFSENDVELVEHSDRFSIKKRIQELPDFFTRSMKQNEI